LPPSALPWLCRPRSCELQARGNLSVPHCAVFPLDDLQLQSRAKWSRALRLPLRFRHRPHAGSRRESDDEMTPLVPPVAGVSHPFPEILRETQSRGFWTPCHRKLAESRASLSPAQLPNRLIHKTRNPCHVLHPSLSLFCDVPAERPSVECSARE